jgi:hypothetical protein
MTPIAARRSTVSAIQPSSGGDHTKPVYPTVATAAIAFEESLVVSSTRLNPAGPAADIAKPMRRKAAATTGVASASTAIVPPIPPPIPEIRIVRRGPSSNRTLAAKSRPTKSAPANATNAAPAAAGDAPSSSRR